MNTRVRTRLGIAVLGSLGSAELTRAQTIDPVSLQRSVRSFVINPACAPSSAAEVLSASDFTQFGESVDATLQCDGRFAHATASHESTLRTNLLVAGGESISQGAAGTRTTLHAIASSELLFVFDLPRAVRYEVTGSLMVQGGAPVMGIAPEISLAGVNGPIEFSRTLAPAPDGSRRRDAFFLRGELPAGRYRLIGSARTILDASIDGSALGMCSYFFYFTVADPCPGDFNHDGSVDFFDVDDFVGCFEGLSCPPGEDADFNNDGSVDFFDYDEFLMAWYPGC